MTTPGVVVESTADTPVRSAHPVLASVTFSELHSLRSMMLLPLPPETSVELTVGLGVQPGVGDSSGPAVFGSPVDKDSFAWEACSDWGVFASPRLVRLDGMNKPTRVMIAVRRSARGMRSEEHTSELQSHH